MGTNRKHRKSHLATMYVVRHDGGQFLSDGVFEQDAEPIELIELRQENKQLRGLIDSQLMALQVLAKKEKELNEVGELRYIFHYTIRAIVRILVEWCGLVKVVSVSPTLFRLVWVRKSAETNYETNGAEIQNQFLCFQNQYSIILQTSAAQIDARQRAANARNGKANVVRTEKGVLVKYLSERKLECATIMAQYQGNFKLILLPDGQSVSRPIAEVLNNILGAEHTHGYYTALVRKMQRLLVIDEKEFNVVINGKG